MIVLGIDSSAKTAACGISCEGKTVIDITLNHKRTHSEKLLEMIDMATKLAKIDIKDIDAFAICKGPGSFTGLRIGLSTVKGLCHALNKPCYTCSTLDSLYENVKGEFTKDCLIVPIMDARRNEVYTAIYKNSVKLKEDMAISITALFDIIDSMEFERIIFTGDGVNPNIELIKERYKDKVLFTEENRAYSCGASVIKAALKNKPLDYKEILPLYLRLSQAERERAEKNKE